MWKEGHDNTRILEGFALTILAESLPFVTIVELKISAKNTCHVSKLTSVRSMQRILVSLLSPAVC